MRPLFTLRVQPSAAAVSAARRRITALVGRRWRLPLSDEALDNVALCASEIIANAMRHTGRSSTVRAYWTGTHLRIEVIDSAPGTLADPCPADPDAENGRGLVLVQLIAANWGTRPAPGGKAVWFEIPADARRPDSDRLTARIRRVAPMAWLGRGAITAMALVTRQPR